MCSWQISLIAAPTDFLGLKPVLKSLSEFKNLHYIKTEKNLELYNPVAIKYEKNYDLIEKKISKLPSSILEIIFYQSNIAIVWNEMLGTEELLKIKEAILKIWFSLNFLINLCQKLLL